MHILRTINVLTLASLLILTGCFGLADDTITPADGEDSHTHSDNNEPSSTFFLNTNQQMVENLIFNQTTGDATVTSITLSVYSAAVDPDGDNITCGWDIDLDGNVDYPTICTGEFTNLTIPIADWIEIPGTSPSIHSIALIVIDEHGAAIAGILDLYNPNYYTQSTGDDTQEQMSTKVVLLSTVISDMTVGSEKLFSTFELAPGSEPIQGDDIAYTVTCDNGGTANYANGEFDGATLHTGDGATVTTPVITLNTGITYVVDLDITGCAPAANQDHTLYISVDGGGNTYEELQYGSSPAVGDVVV